MDNNITFEEITNRLWFKVNVKDDTAKSMYDGAGYREKYAMLNGIPQLIYVREHECIEFALDENDDFQVANGALYDTVDKKWIN